MEFLKYAAVIVLALGAFIILGLAVGSGKPIKALLINSLIGISALTVINLIAKFTGVHIPVNEWTFGAAGIYGIPAVAGLLVLQVLM